MTEQTAQGADAPCETGKIRFRTAAAADEHRERVRQARRAGLVGNGHIETGVYHCALCAGWHLTSKRNTGPGARGRRRGSRGRQPGRRS
ncbi:hypothetical protein [Microcystis phage Mwe-JY05]